MEKLEIENIENYDKKDVIHYIYLLKEREFIKCKENIFKIGKSKQFNLSRFSQYPNGSILYFQMIVPDCDKLEKIILSCFKRKYIFRNDIGYEYFQGDYDCMIEDIYYEICRFRNKNNKDKNPSQSISFENFNYIPS